MNPGVLQSIWIRRLHRDGLKKNRENIEEPRSKLRGMFCLMAVLRIDRKEFCLI